MRKLSTLRTLALFAALLGAAACTMHHTGAGPVDASDEQAVRHLEDQVVAATDRNDADALEPLLAPEFYFVNPGGGIWDRARWLQIMRDGTLSRGSYTVDDVRIHVHVDAAIVTHRSAVVGTFQGEDISSSRRRTMLFVKRGGKWLVAAQQSTPIITR